MFLHILISDFAFEYIHRNHVLYVRNFRLVSSVVFGFKCDTVMQLACEGLVSQATPFTERGRVWSPSNAAATWCLPRQKLDEIHTLRGLYL